MPDPALTPAASLLTAALVLGALAIVGLVAVHREALRRVLLRAGDPRPLALFRITFGLCLLQNLVETAPQALYLFSDEGLIPRAAVPQVHGMNAMLGVGDGLREPAGLIDGSAALHYLISGRWSLLHFWDSPDFVRGYLGVYALACVGLILGWRSRLCAALCWLLFAGLLRRGDAHWGGEQVYCALLFPLMLSRCGEAFSVDNLLRCRRLRARGLLSAPGGPGDGAGAPRSSAHPQGLAAIYRRVPVWPQALIAANLAICYAANGWVKSGPLWASGDALMYALHLDSYARLDWHPLVLALGPIPLRLATWAVLWWERLFPLVLVAMWLRASADSGAPRPDGASRRLARACWLTLAAALLLAAALPENLVEKPGLPPRIERAVCLALAAAGVAVGLLLAGRAPTLRLGARRLRLDRALLGRVATLWLGFGLAFHLVNFTLLNVGAFALATLTAYLLCGAGPAAVRGLQRVTRALARRGIPVPEHMSRETAIACEDPSLPQLRRDGAALPGWALAGAGGLLLLGATLSLAQAPRSGLAWWHAAWLSAGTGLLLLGWRQARRGGEEAPLREPWAYGPAGRLAAGGLLGYHLVALLAWQLPTWPALPYRDTARALVDPWMELSFTRQVWQMFAPNPPRHNQTLRTRIVDADGDHHDLRTELQHHLPRPYLRQDRGRKIMEGVRGGRRQLAPWHARHLCRQWTIEHAGEAPQRVILERVTAPILPYDHRDALDYFWAEARVEPILGIDCADAPFAQPDPELRARHGLPPAPPGSLRYTWPEGQPATWAERRAKLDPLAPLWPALALLLLGALAVWAREDRRRHVARIAARRHESTI
jgi:hypothetical protein